MGDALRQIGLIKYEFGEEYLKVGRSVPDKVTAESMFKYLFKTKDVQNSTKAVQDSRRRVLNFFRAAYRLYEIGYLSKKSMGIIADLSGYRLLFDVVWSLTRVDHFANIDPPDATKFEWFERLERQFPP